MATQPNCFRNLSDNRIRTAHIVVEACLRLMAVARQMEKADSTVAYGNYQMVRYPVLPAEADSPQSQTGAPRGTLCRPTDRLQRWVEDTYGQVSGTRCDTVIPQPPNSLGFTAIMSNGSPACALRPPQ